MEGAAKEDLSLQSCIKVQLNFFSIQRVKFGQTVQAAKRAETALGSEESEGR